MSALIIYDKIVHYEVLGRGRPIIFLHGWIGSWRYWIPAMQKVSISFRAYALDLWGFGDTSKDPYQYDVSTQVELLVNFFLELGIAKVALVGHGLGALVAILFTRRFPAMVDRIMAVACPLNIQAIHERLRVSSPLELVEWLLNRNASSEPVRTDASKIDPQAVVRSFDMWNKIDIHSSLLDGIQTPCLLVHGQGDPAIKAPREDYLAALPLIFHNITFEQAGHFPMLDKAQKFNNLLTDFMTLESGMSPRELQLKEEWRRRMR